MFTEILKWDKKSAVIGVFTWVIVKIHGKDRRKPKLSVSAISPQVSIFDSFAACSVYEDSLLFFLESGGITMICEPVSNKNRYPVFLSRM